MELENNSQMEEEVQIDSKNGSASPSSMKAESTTLVDCAEVKKEVVWMNQADVGLTRGELATEKIKYKPTRQPEFTPQARSNKAYFKAIRAMVPEEHHSLELGKKRTWKDVIFDQVRWAATRPSKSVPRYVEPIFYHGIDKKQDPARPHKCIVCLNSFSRKNNLIQHQRSCHSFHGIGKNHELFMTEDKGHFGVRCLICSKSERSPALLVRHFVVAHTYKERVAFNLEWMVEEELLDDQTSIRCMLGDLTKIGRFTWDEIKDDVMKGLHKREK